ncbi:hypothetical protein [Streptomyces sp. NPDC056061]|uniref:hypothetical protein n=1 Tax=Streptomyces sp. NPDC056061 TaxID=3345700 RepID=UPI0035E2CAC4
MGAHEVGHAPAERGLVAPVADVTLLDRWETVLATAAPELVGHVQLRWITPKLIAAATTAAPTANVRAPNILPPSPRKTSPTADTAAPAAPAPRTPAPAAQPGGRPRPKHPCHLAALAAHRTAGGTRETGLAPCIREAVDRQTQALLQRREPEYAFTEVSAQEEILQAQARQRPAQPDGTLEDTIRTALTYKRRGIPAARPSPSRIAA